MSDDTGNASFEAELDLRGLKFERRALVGQFALILKDYPVPRGPNAGRAVELGVVLPADYPSAAPNGVHTKRSEVISSKVANPQESELGADWMRWSRVVQKWVPGSRRAELYFAQVDAWLERV